MKKKIFLIGVVATIMISLLSLLCACGNKIPQKYVKEWDEKAEYSEADYRVLEVGEEVRILQLTDIHYDNSNNRKEDTLKLHKDTIEKADADMIAVTGDWCYMAMNKKEKCKEVFDIIDSYNVPWAPVFCGHDHANNSEYVYEGVRLVYGVQSGWCKNYADDCIKGGTMAVLDGKDVRIEVLIWGD